VSRPVSLRRGAFDAPPCFCLVARVRPLIQEGARQIQSPRPGRIFRRCRRVCRRVRGAHGGKLGDRLVRGLPVSQRELSQGRRDPSVALEGARRVARPTADPFFRAAAVGRADGHRGRSPRCRSRSSSARETAEHARRRQRVTARALRPGLCAIRQADQALASQRLTCRAHVDGRARVHRLASPLGVRYVDGDAAAVDHFAGVEARVRAPDPGGIGPGELRAAGRVAGRGARLASSDFDRGRRRLVVRPAARTSRCCNHSDALPPQSFQPHGPDHRSA
jgi:hypothetical protein